MNNKSLIFLAIKSLDIQNQISLTSNIFNLSFDIQLNQIIIDSQIKSDKDLKSILLKVLNSIGNQSLDSNDLANNYKRRFRYYFSKMSFFRSLEKSIYENNILIDNLGITGLYLLYLIVEKEDVFKLWLYYKNYTFDQLIRLIETKNNFYN
uniref:Uncharacterized protein ORF148 n=2 Tax=Pyropia yezoensis TaxID=2788 RepID=YCXJ_PYRYE|nr:hypothetical protein 148 [Neopyropia yezoensis]Q1XDD7.1 RecName: Full=Uncharacterized protein ORF148 [Neopyropia yezoensis]AGH27678.1 hypothetical protein 148 [Neopyropia yezoensis]QFZ67014.1 hypothetical protein PyyePp168 [Neopyropia yezoensis]WKD83509.1 hypothetical protein [Neopyropia yezoensis]BAE92474.1 unnamed protein product [Neopyropia yezoensis]